MLNFCDAAVIRLACVFVSLKFLEQGGVYNLSDITNPYRVGEPVVDPSHFFGRQDVADWVEIQITAQARVLLVSGQPHIGKTSLIKQIGYLQSAPYFNLVASLSDLLAISTPEASSNNKQTGGDVYTIEQVLEPLIADFIPQLVRHGLLSNEQAAIPFYPTGTTLRELFLKVQPRLDRPLLLYVDDLQALITEDMALLATFLSLFMPILDECPQLFLVFTVYEDQISQIRHPLLDAAPTFHLSTLSPDASNSMITQPVKNILRFDYGITRHIAEINSHHPYYLTLFCRSLLDRQHHDGWVNQRAFDATLAQILATPIEPFTKIWEDSSWIERAVLSSMAAMRGKHGPVMQQEVIRFLQDQDRGLVSEVVIDALKTLADRGILVSMGAISYRFHVELFRFWLREHTEPVETLKYVDWSRLNTQLQRKVRRIRPYSHPWPGKVAQDEAGLEF